MDDVRVTVTGFKISPEFILSVLQAQVRGSIHYNKSLVGIFGLPTKKVEDDAGKEKFALEITQESWRVNGGWCQVAVEFVAPQGVITKACSILQQAEYDRMVAGGSTDGSGTSTAG